MNFFSSTANSLVDFARPSIFLLTASSSLQSSLQPAIQHAITYLAENFPHLLSRHLYLLSDEITAFVELLASCHFLKYFGALFNEHFYGLVRQRLNVRRTVLLHVILPYVKLKGDRLYEQWMTNDVRTSDREPFSLKQALRLIYPCIHFSYQALNLISHLLYVSARTARKIYIYEIQSFSQHSISHWMESSELFHISEENEQAFKENRDKLPYLVKLAHKLFWMSLEFGAFLLQFLDHWLNRDDSTRSNDSTPTPVPPMKTEGVGIEPNKCPLCRSVKIQTPAVLTICGYVFCYRCIIEHVRGQGKCPITSLPVGSHQIVRLFQQ